MTSAFADERCAQCGHDELSHWMPVNRKRSGLPNPASECRCWACPPEKRCQGFVAKDAAQ